MTNNEKLFSPGLRERFFGQRVLILDGALDDDNGTVLATQMLSLASDDPRQDIALWINSPGGSVPSMLAIGFKFLPKTPIGKAFLGELPREEEILPEDPRRALIGRVGVVRSKMLPSGAVEIDGQMVDAVTQGQAIDPGSYVVVIEVRANRVVVRPAGKDQRPSHQNSNDLLSRPIEELGIESLDDPLA